jgi:hypothetical protein
MAEVGATGARGDSTQWNDTTETVRSTIKTETYAPKRKWNCFISIPYVFLEKPVGIYRVCEALSRKRPRGSSIEKEFVPVLTEKMKAGAQSPCASFHSRIENMISETSLPS